ncbi:MAG: hypothetical protein Q8916_09430 [Bacteroidota bacterium]|nr:hypothetical protein [Bacteroidota bacterium]
MTYLHRRSFLLPLGIGLFILSSCCVPKEKNSFPMVIDTSYTDTAVKDAIDIQNVDVPLDPFDSGYYPVYSLDIKNTGSEGDTFYLTYSRVRNGYLVPLTAQQYVGAGETKTFRTYGPSPSNPPDTVKVKYYSFYVKTLDSISLFVLQPQITIHYGQSPNGPEECGSAGKDITVDPLKLKHK